MHIAVSSVVVVKSSPHSPLLSCVTLTTQIAAFKGKFQALLSARQVRIVALSCTVSYHVFPFPYMIQTGWCEVEGWEKAVVPSQTIGILPRWDPTH